MNTVGRVISSRVEAISKGAEGDDASDSCIAGQIISGMNRMYRPD
ncbi:MAG TPA: hypothetical protein VNI77_03055 [Nitrososphaera sp.]|nr:hypothetical protein [Nitrososphaera sp.]